MRVLIAAASKHGATTGIAGAIAERLTTHGCEVTVAAPEQVRGIDAYDTIVLGSAVYAGHWLKSAKDLGTARRRAP